MAEMPNGALVAKMTELLDLLELEEGYKQVSVTWEPSPSTLMTASLSLAGAPDD